MSVRRKIGLLCLLLPVWAGAAAGVACACDVPVFRYALERWPAEVYQVFVFHEGALGPAQRQLADRLALGKINLRVDARDVSSRMDAYASALWRRQEAMSLPRVVLAYPTQAKAGGTVWSGPLSAESVKLVHDSPVRKEVARRLVAGHSAVWLLLESGQAEKDIAAAELLQAELAGMRAKLMEAEGEATATDLEVEFSMIRVSRKDPAEAVLSAMLMRSEPDLESNYASEPMAFPVFGRGRTLYALVGKGVSAENILEACRFITGPCACEIKAENPGVDLLMVADWDAAVKKSLIADVELPPLTTVSAQAGDPQVAAEKAPQPSAHPRAPASPAATPPVAASEAPHRFVWHVVIALGIIVAAVAGLSVAVRRRLPEK